MTPMFRTCWSALWRAASMARRLTQDDIRNPPIRSPLHATPCLSLFHRCKSGSMVWSNDFGATDPRPEFSMNAASQHSSKQNTPEGGAVNNTKPTRKGHRLAIAAAALAMLAGSANAGAAAIRVMNEILAIVLRIVVSSKRSRSPWKSLQSANARRRGRHRGKPATNYDELWRRTAAHCGG